MKTDAISTIADYSHQSTESTLMSQLPMTEVIDQIVELNYQMCVIWTTKAKGWVPRYAAELLSKSRIDWQVSLSECLRIWLTPGTYDESDGRLILAWANLGALVECGLKLYLTVWSRDYRQDTDAVIRKGKVVQPDCLQLEQLRQFLKKKQLWDEEWVDWIEKIQHRRTAIHAFKDRDIGDWGEFFEDVRKYREYLHHLNSYLPYPD